MSDTNGIGFGKLSWLSSKGEEEREKTALRVERECKIK
jgi:hypothetical protein